MLMSEDFKHFLDDPLFIKDLFIANDLRMNGLCDLPPAARTIHEVTLKVFGTGGSLKNISNSDLVSVLTQIKGIIYDLSSQMISTIHKNIDEALDLVCIGEELENNPSNLNHRLTLVLNIIAKICSPARDRQVMELKSKQSPSIEFLRDLYCLLGDMRLDMCNFLLKHHREKVIEHATRIEHNLFQEYRLKMPNCHLKNTNEWLQKAIHQNNGVNSLTNQILDDEKIIRIMNNAYRLLINMSEAEYPETIFLDVYRIKKINAMYTSAVFVASLLNILSKHLAKLKPHDDLIEMKVVNIAFSLKQYEMQDQKKMQETAKEIISFLECQQEKAGLPAMASEYKKFFITKMKQLTKVDDPVRQLFEKRILGAIFDESLDIDNPQSLHQSLKALFDTIWRINDVYSRFTGFNRRAHFQTYRKILEEKLSQMTSN